jgi:hypothetical protein
MSRSQQSSAVEGAKTNLREIDPREDGANLTSSSLGLASAVTNAMGEPVRTY